jgi:hypothetical protein
MRSPTNILKEYIEQQTKSHQEAIKDIISSDQLHNESYKLSSMPSFLSGIIATTDDNIEIADDSQFQKLQDILSVFYNQRAISNTKQAKILAF